MNTLAAPTVLQVLTVALMIGITIGALIASRWISRKEDELWADSNMDGAVLREKCQLRVGCVDCPGVVSVVGDDLVLRGVLIKERRLPLSQIKLKKETAGTGKYYWWGKRLFHLDAPGISELVIGVKNPEPWRSLFRAATK